MSSLSSRNSQLVIAAETWLNNSVETNDSTLRSAFCRVLEASKHLPAEQRLIMYDACDKCEVKAPLGDICRKRLDPRRNTKPKKPDNQTHVCTPFDSAAFNFGKISNPGERLLEITHSGSAYTVLTNKFPLFPKHMLLVAKELVPQQLTLPHLRAVTDIIKKTSFCAYFNSWCASASVNHFHCHIIDEHPPVTMFPFDLATPMNGSVCYTLLGYPGHCYVLPIQSIEAACEAVNAMQEDNIPHNLLFTPTHIYIWPKPEERSDRSFELYPETVGGPELLGSFTLYSEAEYRLLNSEAAEELIAINTAPLPARLISLPPSQPLSRVPWRLGCAPEWIARKRDAGAGQ